GQAATERARASTARTAAGEEGAQVGGTQIPDIAEPRRTAEMARQELQELPWVALIGVQRQRRQPALACPHLQPSPACGLQVGLRGDEKLLHGISPCGSRCWAEMVSNR